MFIRLQVAIWVLTVLLSASAPRAQQRPNVDTMTLGGMRPSVPAGLYHHLSKYDTIFWNPDAQAGMLRTPDEGFGHKGEYRVAIQDGKVEQVTFAIGAHNKDEAKKYYGEIYSSLTGLYGNPDGSSPTEFRWEGMEQFFAVRLSDEGNAVNIVLSKFERH